MTKTSVIDKAEFQRVVDSVEAEQEFDSLDDLWDAVSDTEWAEDMNPRPLTKFKAKAEAERLGIVTKTGDTKPADYTPPEPEPEPEPEPVKAAASPKRPKLEPPPEPPREKISLGRGILAISTPAGKCPVKLEADCDESDVISWGLSVREHGDVHGRFFLASALKYWVRQFFWRERPDFMRFCFSVIDQNFDSHQYMEG